MITSVSHYYLTLFWQRTYIMLVITRVLYFQQTIVSLTILGEIKKNISSSQRTCIN